VTLLLVSYCPSCKFVDSKKKVRYRGETHAVLTVAAPRMHGQHSVVAGIKHPNLSRLNDDFFLLVAFDLLVGVAQIAESHADRTPHGGYLRRSHPRGLANDARTMSDHDISSLASRNCFSRRTRKSTRASGRYLGDQPCDKRAARIRPDPQRAARARSTLEPVNCSR
jgi:hypothetical protein